MDIRNWGLDQVMMLPDHCFGRRWPIGLQSFLEGAGAVFDVSEAALPERCIVWEVFVSSVGAIGTTSAGFTLALGDQLPANVAAFNACELVFSGIDSRSRRGEIEVVSGAGFNIRNLRLPLAVSGRRFVGAFIRVLGSPVACHAIIVVSSIPKEVPDCLLSV